MTTLDYAFSVAGDVIERDYPVGLYRALAAVLPWLEGEPLAGVHPMRGLTPCPGGLLVGGRTRITLRIPEPRVEACAALQGADLALASPLHVGRASRRELLAYPVLHGTYGEDGTIQGLFLTGVTAGMTGNQYRVAITGTCAPTTSAAGTLTVNTLPVVTVNPSDVTVCEGTGTTFSVTATGTGVTYQWQEDTRWICKPCQRRCLQQRDDGDAEHQQRAGQGRVPVPCGGERHVRPVGDLDVGDLDGAEEPGGECTAVEFDHMCREQYDI